MGLLGHRNIEEYSSQVIKPRPTRCDKKMPEDVDELISHEPPAGILDRISRGKHVGDRALGTQVEEIQPRVHNFGHIRQSCGTQKTGETPVCNAALFDGHAPGVNDVPVEKGPPASVVE